MTNHMINSNQSETRFSFGTAHLAAKQALQSERPANVVVQMNALPNKFGFYPEKNSLKTTKKMLERRKTTHKNGTTIVKVKNCLFCAFFVRILPYSTPNAVGVFDDKPGQTGHSRRGFLNFSTS